MVSRSLQRSQFAVAVCLATALAFLPAPARAASKIAIAAMGDAAPGGGVFAGPSFIGTPSSAGDGWIAFRALVAEGNTTEQIVATNLRTRERRVVASLGQTVGPTVGRLKQFLGRPTVNARGEVAFAAIVTPPEDVKQDPLAPTPAGVFLSTGGPNWRLDVVAEPGLDTGFGILDLTTPVNVLAEGGTDIPERTPALNDAGDVAFVASTLDKFTADAAIFVRRAGGPLAHVVKLGDPFGDGAFAILGPPALNNTGGLAFRGFADGGGGFLDGIFKLQAGALTLLAANGILPQRPSAPFPNDQTLFEFGDTVALNDAGDVLFIAGPLFDLSDDASLSDEGGPGIVVWRQGATYLVAFPGQPIAGRGRITSIELGPDGGSDLAPPAFAPDGQIVFFASLNGGSSEMLIRTGLLDEAPGTIVDLGGATGDETPVGGTYLAAASAPVVDALGTVVFFARIAGSPVSQAVIALPPDRPGEAINIGDPAAGSSDGFFGGPPFSAPVLNDADDVVFKSFVARGPALGIFRWRGGQLEAMVRVGDVAPVEDGRAFTNLVGDPSMNAAGDIAFAATAAGVARGIYTAGSGGLRAVAVPGQPLSPPDPERNDAFFRTLAPNPAISDTGAVVFRGTIEFDDPLDFFRSIKEEVVLLADASGTRILAARGQDSGVGKKFFKFRDPSTRGGPVVFRAPLGEDFETGTGLFLADPSGIAPLAVKGDDIGGMTITDLTGRAQIDAAGNVAFAGKLRRPGSAEVAAILRRTPAGFTSIAEARQTGPFGGRFRSLGRPTAASGGNVAFRGTFEPFSGGTPGFFLATPAGLTQLLRAGEGAPAPIGGRITTLNQAGSLNARDHLAFLAGVGGGSTRSAIFLAAPTTTAVKSLRVRRKLPSNDLDFTPKDRIVVNATVAPATTLPDIAEGSAARVTGGTKKTRRQRERLRPQAVSLAVGDQRGTLWSVTLPASAIEARGRALVAKPGSEQPIAGLRVRIARDGTIRVKARSTALDFAFSSGSRPFDQAGLPQLFPPFAVRVDVGAEGGAASVPCDPKKLSFRCGR